LFQQFKGGEMYWWGFNKTHGWVVLDRTILSNQSGQVGDLVFHRAKDGEKLKVPRNQWSEPHFVFAPKYLSGRPKSEEDDFEILKNSVELNLDSIRAEQIKELLKQKELQAIANHQDFLKSKGLPYRGVANRSSNRTHRITHCYSCKDSLDNEIQSECAGCKWIICECGACGCGYERRSY